MKNCDSIFDTRCDLENHMENHDDPREFKCKLCDKEFYLQWRLNRHVRGHNESDQKFCHYYNNCNVCPFEKNGCKFRHELSPLCSSFKTCRRHMCPFRHNEDSEMSTMDKTDKHSDNDTFISLMMLLRKLTH